MSKDKKIKTFIFFLENYLFRPRGGDVMGDALQPVQQGSSAQGQSLPGVCLQALFRTRHCGVASARTPPRRPSFHFTFIDGVAQWVLLANPGLHKVWSLLKSFLNVGICRSTAV